MIELTKANIRAAIILGLLFGGGIWLAINLSFGHSLFVAGYGALYGAVGLLLGYGFGYRRWPA